jgi:hypothetical protein
MNMCLSSAMSHRVGQLVSAMSHSAGQFFSAMLHSAGQNLMTLASNILANTKPYAKRF